MALEIERHASSRFGRGRKSEVARAIEARDRAGLLMLTRVYLETRGIKKNLVSSHTHRLYAIGVGRLLDWAWGETGRHLQQITEDDLDAFVLALSEPSGVPGWRALSRSSLDGYLTGVRTFFKALLWAEAIKLDPSLSLRSPRVERNTKRPTLSAAQMLEFRRADRHDVVLSINDVTRAIAPLSQRETTLAARRVLIDLRDAALIELLYGAQLRAAEVGALRLTDVDLVQGQLSVLGKGKKRRTVLLSPGAVRELRAWLAVRGELSTPVSAGAVFVSASNRSFGKPLQYGAVYNIVKERLSALEDEISARGGEGEAITKVSLGGAHTLRRSGATALYEITKDLRSLQVQLGHADIGTTADYVTESRAALRKGLDQLE